MHRQERELTDTCRLCGEDIDAMDPRNYALSAAALLCYECARRQGGKYDSEREEWTAAPRLPLTCAGPREDA